MGTEGADRQEAVLKMEGNLGVTVESSRRWSCVGSGAGAVGEVEGRGH